MTIDIAGSGQAGTVNDPRITYAPRKASGASYRVPGQRQRVLVGHADGLVVVRDWAGGVEGSGPTYLDALWAFDRARRGQTNY